DPVRSRDGWNRHRAHARGGPGEAHRVEPAHGGGADLLPHRQLQRVGGQGEREVAGAAGDPRAPRLLALPGPGADPRRPRRPLGDRHRARLLGAAPVNIAFGEVYSALEKKTVDGAMTSATNAEPMKFFEVAKYLDYWYLAGAAQEWLVANQKAWDALPKDLQQAVLDSMKDVNLEEKEWQDATAADEKVRKRLPELGMTVIEPSKEEMDKARKIAKGAWDIWLQRTGADGKRALELALKALGR